MSSIENLKKQAKALVRLHAEKSYHLSSVAREVLPKFAAMTDRQVLAGPFKLADAQALLARQHGCVSWAELKAKVESGALAPPPPQPATQDMVFAMPILFVSDVRRSLDHYERVLGFERLMVAGEPPFYAEVKRGGALLAVRLVHGPAYTAAMAEETMFSPASIRVADAKVIYLEFTAAGAEFETPLRREPWGAWGFTVKDPDGNVVIFGDSAKTAEQP